MRSVPGMRNGLDPGAGESKRSGLLAWLVVAALTAGCDAGDHYQLTLSPVTVTAQVIDSFTVDVTTDFSSEAPIYTTTVEISLEPAIVVSTPNAGDITFGASDTLTEYDPGPPAGYSFRPGDAAGGVTTQKVRFRCLTDGEAVASFSVDWVGGNPDDPSLTEEHGHGSVAIVCQ